MIDETVKMQKPTFNITNMTSTRIFVTVTYPDAELLSKNSLIAVDYLKIIWNNTDVLLTQQEFVSFDKSWSFTKKLQPQKDRSQATTTAATQGEAMVFTMSSIMSSNFVINILMSSSLQELWGQLNVLQLVLFTPLLNLLLPMNVQVLCGALISITTFDILDSQSITNYIFGADNFNPDSLTPLSE